MIRSCSLRHVPIPNLSISCTTSRHLTVPNICTEHDTVLQNDDDRLNNYWREKMTIAYQYVKHRPAFLNMREIFEDMWNSYLERIMTSKQEIELDSDNVRPVQNGSYRAIVTARTFSANEIDRMLKEYIIEPAKTEWSRPIVFSTHKTFCSYFVSSIESYTLKSSETVIFFSEWTTESTR